MPFPWYRLFVALVFAFVLGWTAIVKAVEASDPAQGEKVFVRCKVCHGGGAGRPNDLRGVVGRAAATGPKSVGGHLRSAAMHKAGADGLMWTPENLDAFLAKPSAFLPGTKMWAPGLKKAQDRADVIAYLKTLAAQPDTE
jgi:cytochrome c